MQHPIKILSITVTASLVTLLGTGGAYASTLPHYVTNFTDSVTTPGTLRDAITALSGQAYVGGIPTLYLAPGTYSLTQGPLDLAGAINIVGQLGVNGQPDVTITGDNLSRVFDIAAGSDVTISGVRITGGLEADGNGGGILNDGILTLDNCVVSGNRSEGSNGTLRGGGFGGGIANYGRLSLTNVSFIANGALGGNGASAEETNSAGAGGGGGGGAGLGGGLFNGSTGTVHGFGVSFMLDTARGGNGGNSGPNDGVFYSTGANGGGAGGSGGSFGSGTNGLFGGGGGGGAAGAYPGFAGGVGGFGGGGGGGGGQTSGGSGEAGGVGGFGAGNGGQGQYSGGAGGGGGAGIGGAVFNAGGFVAIVGGTVADNIVAGGIGGLGAYGVGNGQSGQGIASNFYSDGGQMYTMGLLSRVAVP